nr:unnamed protein product [Spirometra erinaceieuropaei]
MVHNVMSNLATVKPDQKRNGCVPSARLNLAWMLVPLRTCGSKIEEWTLLELQGEISHNNASSVAGEVVGDLHFTRQNEPILIIGHNLLCGKVSKLARPFAVLQRTRSGSSTNLSVKAVIRTKILFKTRPKPIIWMKN